jgi:hypothetical protein
LSISPHTAPPLLRYTSGEYLGLKPEFTLFPDDDLPQFVAFFPQYLSDSEPSSLYMTFLRPSNIEDRISEIEENRYQGREKTGV